MEEEGTFLKPFCEATITLIPKPDKDSTGKENYRPVSWMNTDAKSLNKGSYAIVKLDLPQGHNNGKHMQSNQYDISHQQKKTQKPNNLFSRCRKSIW